MPFVGAVTVTAGTIRVSRFSTINREDNFCRWFVLLLDRFGSLVASSRRKLREIDIPWLQFWEKENETVPIKVENSRSQRSVLAPFERTRDLTKEFEQLGEPWQDEGKLPSGILESRKLAAHTLPKTGSATPWLQQNQHHP